MKKLYKKIIILSLLSLTLNASTLKEIVQMTLKNNINIKSMNYDIDSKNETLKSVSNTFNPTINIGINYSKLDLDIRSSQVGTTTMGYIKFGVDLYDGGKNSSIKKQKKYELESTKLSKDVSTKEILLQVVTFFYQIKTIEENILAYQDKSKSLFAEYKREKKKYNIQMVTIDKVYKLQSEYESNKYIIEDLKYQKDYLYQNLTLLVGKKITSVSNSKLPNVMNLKYQASTKIQSLKSNIEAINENINQISTIKKLKIKLEDSINIYNYNNYDEGILKDLPNQQNQLMLSFSLNLYDSSSSNKKQSAILTKMVKKEQLNYTISKEKIEFNLATKKLTTQKAKIDSVKSALDMAISVYDIVLTKYQNGVVDNITYLDSLSKKTINKSLYIQALNNYEIAKANYYFSSGISYKKIIKLL